MLAPDEPVTPLAELVRALEIVGGLCQQFDRSPTLHTLLPYITLLRQWMTVVALREDIKQHANLLP